MSMVGVMDGSPSSSVKFYYEKGNFFRVIHVDGVIGGPTPERAIFVALYNQRSPIPKEVTQEICADGTLGRETEHLGKDGIFREVEIGFVLTEKAAEEVGQFLLQQAKLLRDTEKDSPQRVATGFEEQNEHVTTSRS